MKKGLSALLHPHSVSDFMESFEQNRPFVVHHESDDLKALTELPFLASLEAMLKTWTGKIQAHLPDVRDESSSIDVTSVDAQKVFNNGMGLLFNQAQTLSPILVEWLEEIQQELGLSQLSYGRCLVYATPKNKGTAPHFDQNINFVLQVHGEKTWYIAPNEHLANPLTRFTMGQEPDDEMQGYLETEFPTKMPANAEKIVLKPGSLLFVPRGAWHSTDAQEDALSLNFTFTMATWIDIFTAALKSRLSMAPEWREAAYGLNESFDRETAEMKFNALLGSIVDDLPNWQAQDILNATEGILIEQPSEHPEEE
jgi:50S ribosomal protein L16 3-hydroxylase